MKVVYMLRRHRLAPAKYQGAHRKRAVYSRDYEVIFMASDPFLVTRKRVTYEMQPRMGTKPEPFKYSVGRMEVVS